MQNLINKYVVVCFTIVDVVNESAVSFPSGFSGHPIR